MKKIYALYNLNKKCIEHLKKVILKSEKNYIYFKLDNDIGEIWTTEDENVAEMVRLKKFTSDKLNSREYPYNPYSSNDLIVIELETTKENKIGFLPIIEIFKKNKPDKIRISC